MPNVDSVKDRREALLGVLLSIVSQSNPDLVLHGLFAFLQIQHVLEKVLRGRGFGKEWTEKSSNEVGGGTSGWEVWVGDGGTGGGAFFLSNRTLGESLKRY